MNDTLRGSGRTTRMLEEVLQYRKDNPLSIPVVLAASKPHAAMLERMYRGIGGDPYKVWFYPCSQEKWNEFLFIDGNPYFTKDGIKDDTKVFVDHYTYEKYGEK